MKNNKIKPITAVILADGKNSRIQKEKSLIKIGNCHLLTKQIKLLSNIFEKILIVTSKDILRKKFPNIRIVEDYYKDCGPLAGIHTALSNCETKYIFVFACDMPNLNKELIQNQINYFLDIQPEALIPKHIEGIEPLHSIYSTDCLPRINENLRKNHCSIRGFYKKINLKYFTIEEKDIKHFFNINTHHDLIKYEIVMNRYKKVSNFS
ncbi:MAG: molybdenum cofactor guanylyltransferase [Candidatus Cloacimonetes bacterium]|nr:molybdenum cofactor guanylyltransferase [Candidatus Cloacimonadota bacterium]